MRESPDKAVARWQLLEAVQAEYPGFIPFLREVMAVLGFSTTIMQEDIASFLEYGPHFLMIQAQRGEAKTTITAAFAVWHLIHNPAGKILILSAGGTQANEISTLIVRIIMSMDELACMRPDRNAGDRTSTEAFDIHHSLKGIDKSPSVACVGIGGNLQGKRATLLIADDIESQKNSKTEHLREELLHLTRDFPSICNDGRIVYLGTPQSTNSVYNSLPGRGYTVRIWPGRFPTEKQEANYGDMLAPYIRELMKANPSLRNGGGALGDQGQPTDPQLPAGREEKLQEKERDQGPSYFQLQHMLNTKLADAERFPLKLASILVARLAGDHFPLTVTPGMAASTVVKYAIDGKTYEFNSPAKVSEDRSKLQGIVMHVDPAGGGKNGDETGYAIVGFLNGNIWVLEVGGVKGGFGDAEYRKVAQRAAYWGVQRIMVEKNFGNGAYLHSWLPILRAEYKAVQSGQCHIEEVWEAGQKELRIIDTLEPVIARGALLFNADIIEGESASIAQYPAEHRASYSLLNQIALITRDRDCLKHDDRLDALAGAVRYWVQQLGIEQKDAVDRLRKEEYAKWARNPLGIPGFGKAPAGGSMFNKYRR
ncbi:terminase large subunit [Ralstonia phage RSJ2]|uniref:Putative TerL large terminase subunit-like protein n=1 Tax=Ralstonia phage RSJ2 TaxID=1481785 RepID=A0A068Q5S5_9CAUD|nr:terminase large subunit [Ralstonia phage RSJ2]BAP15846.1 putative TerL large terminase subunit-like protein [Ralstonia phage RSJ2]